MTTKQTVLITGAYGFTGLHACRYFLQAGWDVVAAVRKEKSFSLDCKIIECDLTDCKSVSQMIRKVSPNFILHLAGINAVSKSWVDPLTTMEANVFGTLNLLEAARQHAPFCRTLVIGSALAMSFRKGELPQHPYSLSKSLQALLSQSWQSLFDQNIIIARPSNLIGPGPSTGVVSIFARTIAELERDQKTIELMVSNPKNKREYLDLRDAIKAYEILLVSGNPGTTYEIGSGKLLTLQEILDAFQEETKVKIKGIDQRNNRNVCSVMDTALINKLGWSPKVTFKESIRDILRYHRERQI